MPRLAGVLDLSHEVQKEDTFDDDEEVTEIVMARKRSSSTARNVKQYFGIANGTSGLVSRQIISCGDLQIFITFCTKSYSLIVTFHCIITVEHC